MAIGIDLGQVVLRCHAIDRLFHMQLVLVAPSIPGRGFCFYIDAISPIRSSLIIEMNRAIYFHKIIIPTSQNMACFEYL